MAISCAAELAIIAVPGIPVLGAMDDLPAIVLGAMRQAHIDLFDGDVVVVASKAVSRAEGRFVDLSTVKPSPRARELARQTGKDDRLVEVILGESLGVSRVARDVLITRHRRGFVCANAGVDLSNAEPAGTRGNGGPWALLLPRDPDASADTIRRALAAATAARIGVIVSDSFGRPFRLGSVGVAVGVAGVPALWDRCGDPDLFERKLEHTVTALADQIAAAADLVAGQAAERRAVVVVRGVSFDVGAHAVDELLRPADKDLYA